MAKKDMDDLIGLSKKSITNQILAVKDSILKRPPHYDMHGLIDANKLTWFLKNLSHLGNFHYRYQAYQSPSINNGIFKMPGEGGKEISIALLSDWASDTMESHNIAALTGQKDYSIHLGDTYYVGNSQEIAENFNNKIGPWPYGSLGSFALLGNHEMYSSGKSYFTGLLDYMGIYSPTRKKQEASFFCLENEHWRIIGLDTGYDSLTGWLGIKPNLKLKLHDTLIKWLRDTVKLGDKSDKRGIILLSHHQFISGFEKEQYSGPAAQLAALLGDDRTILWFWGHEHRLAIYGSNHLPEGGAKFFARCIGHSGMPVELQHKPKNITNPMDPVNCNLVLYDGRERKMVDNISLGYNGYVILKLKDNELTAEYYDDNDNNQAGVTRMILSEKWAVDGGGALSGVEIRDLTETSVKKLTQFQSGIKIAIE